MKTTKYWILLAIWSSNAAFGGVNATPSLCASHESVIFSCETARSKTVALCLNGQDKIITYKFGKTGKFEMTYQASKMGRNVFFYNHYLRAGVDYTRIYFVKAGYEYSVFRDYDATESQIPRYGVAVSRGGDDEVQIKCQSQVVDNLSKIIKYLNCDESSALGCY